MTLAIINTPEAKRRINGAFQDISDVLTQIEAGRDTIKQIVADYSEEFQIEKAMFKTLANTYHKQNFGDKSKKNTDFEILYETLTGEKADGAELVDGDENE
jgi:hypothetical protein